MYKVLVGATVGALALSEQAAAFGGPTATGSGQNSAFDTYCQFLNVERFGGDAPTCCYAYPSQLGDEDNNVFDLLDIEDQFPNGGRDEELGDGYTAFAINTNVFHQCPFEPMGYGGERVPGTPDFSPEARLCTKSQRDKHTTALRYSIWFGMFGAGDGFKNGIIPGPGSGSNSGNKDCTAWCLFDVRSPNHHFRWKERKQCWEFKRYRTCTDATPAEYDHADRVREKICPQPSCMAGATEVLTIVNDTSIDVDEYETPQEAEKAKSNFVSTARSVPVPQKVAVEDLSIGDKIEGLDADKNQQFCEVVAVGQFGAGPLYGNYTKDHFILDESADSVVMHGSEGEVQFATKYGVLTECPVGVDGSGVAFTAIDSDFCGVDKNELSWSDYVKLHTAILRVVRQSGPYWFSLAAYQDPNFASFTPKICSSMLKCLNDDTQCDALESVAVHFIDNVLAPSATKQTRKSFPHLGETNMEGSVSYTVTGKGKPFLSTTAGIVTLSAATIVVVAIIASVIVVMRRKRATVSEPQKEVEVVNETSGL